jgi:hypothetical protein
MFVFFSPPKENKSYLVLKLYGASSASVPAPLMVAAASACLQSAACLVAISWLMMPLAPLAVEEGPPLPTSLSLSLESSLLSPLRKSMEFASNHLDNGLQHRWWGSMEEVKGNIWVQRLWLAVDSDRD